MTAPNGAELENDEELQPRGVNRHAKAEGVRGSARAGAMARRQRSDDALLPLLNPCSKHGLSLSTVALITSGCGLMDCPSGNAPQRVCRSGSRAHLHHRHLALVPAWRPDGLRRKALFLERQKSLPCGEVVLSFATGPPRGKRTKALLFQSARKACLPLEVLLSFRPA